MEVSGHPHRMTFGNIEFHLPISLPLGKSAQVILQNLETHGGFYIPLNHKIIRTPLTVQIHVHKKEVLKAFPVFNIAVLKIVQILKK